MNVNIVIVEDEVSLAKLLAYNLGQKGFTVETIADGFEALRRIESNAFDLVILDVMLPSMNGIELCKQVRSRGITVPIIMLTAKSGEEEIVEGLQAGADDYITKPFSVMELVARVQAALRRATAYEQVGSTSHESGTAVDSDQVRYGDIVIHTGKMEVYVQGGKVELRPKEYEILLRLIQKQGYVVTREELMNSVWGYEFIGEQRTVDVHVSSLRKKLEAVRDGGTVIESVRGFGYKLVKQD